MLGPNRRRIIASGLAAGLGAAVDPRRARADAFPNGMTIRVVVPFPAGGITDVIGRALADGLAAHWKTNCIVDIVPGAGGNIGMEKAVNGPADGSQIVIVAPGLVTNQFLYRKLSFNPETDLVPLSLLCDIPNMLGVRKGLPVKSVAELIAYAKANPGKLNVAASAVGTSIHLSAELFKKAAGVEMVNVYYKGAAPALSDLIAGNVDLMFDNLPTMVPQAKAGTVIGLAATSLKRSSFAPDLPTVSETLPGFSMSAWFGVCVRAGVPQPIVDALEEAIVTVCKRDDIRQRFATSLVEVVGSTSKEFGTMIASERKRWGDVITGLAIKLD